MIWLVAFAITHTAVGICCFGLGYAVCRWVRWRKDKKMTCRTILR